MDVKAVQILARQIAEERPAVDVIALGERYATMTRADSVDLDEAVEAVAQALRHAVEMQAVTANWPVGVPRSPRLVQ